MEARTVTCVPQLTYLADQRSLGSFAGRLVTLDIDDDTRRFVAMEQSRPQRRVRWVTRTLAGAVMSSFSADAVFDTHHLFMLSTAQWKQLLGDRAGGRLLDVGAAAGHVTSRLAPLFEDVIATDVSGAMVRRMRRRGLSALKVDVADTPAPGGLYDTVALLNVLDRCERPQSLLRSAVASLPAHGTLIVSMPLPYDPCWYAGPSLRDPVERLDIRGTRWETAAQSLASLIEDRGLGVEAITRAPYVSGGDRRHSLYVLDAAVIVASHHG